MTSIIQPLTNLYDSHIALLRLQHKFIFMPRFLANSFTLHLQHVWRDIFIFSGVAVNEERTFLFCFLLGKLSSRSLLSLYQLRVLCSILLQHQCLCSARIWANECLKILWISPVANNETQRVLLSTLESNFRLQLQQRGTVSLHLSDLHVSG